jgi:aspartyl-tRNA(Asn)/glutamyl-tRNA(Gln) amidotransferase subunit A
MAQTVADCALAHAILTGAPPPVPRIGGRRVGVLVRPPDITGGGAEPGDRDPRADAILERLRELGAIVSEVELPAPEGDTWPVFLADAAAAHAATFPSRADEYGRAVRAKLETASRVSRDEAQRARRLLRAWREVALARPDVDLIASPTLGMTRLPPSGVDELAIRLPFSSYTRPFSLLGWPAIAIGDLQLAGRSSAGVLGAALAIEAARGAVG